MNNEGCCVSFNVSKMIFKQNVLLKSLCRFSDRVSANVACQDNGNFTVSLTALDNSTGVNLENIKKEFLNELIDQQIRCDLEDSSGTIKRLIVEHAFAPFEDIKGKLNHNG